MKKLLAVVLMTAAVLMDTRVVLEHWALPWVSRLGSSMTNKEGLEEIIDNGTFELEPGQTVRNISVERGPDGELVLRITTRPSGTNDSPKTRALYIKDGEQ